MPHSIYLDNSATTSVRPEVREAMLPFLGERFGNPSSVHYFGRESRKAVDEARQYVAALLSCEEDEVYFSPCATYSNNLALLGRARFVEANGQGRHLITSQIEHPSCMGPAKYLESIGWEVTYLPVNSEGIIDPLLFARAIKPQTSIVSIMWANNEIGSVQPVVELANIASQKGIFFHTDAVQIPGKLAINLQALPADTLSLSGHKFYAPKGIGVLFIRRGVNLMPIAFGGGQEKALFPGTESLPNIVAIGQAARLARQEMMPTQKSLYNMQNILMDRLLKIEGIRLTGPHEQAKRLPGHVSFVVPGVEGEAVVMQADLRGICISSASACHKGIFQPSHVVSALGLSEQEAMGSVRISAGRFNTEDECKSAAEALGRIIESLQGQPVKPMSVSCTA